MLPPLSPVSMLATPSIVMLFEFDRWPFALRLLTCVGASVFGTTPGTRPARPKKLRPLTAMFWIAADCSVKARSPLRSWMSVDWPVTVTLSLSWPDRQREDAGHQAVVGVDDDAGPLQRLEAREGQLQRVRCRAGRYGNRKAPFSSDVTVCSVPCAWLTSTTETPGSTPPWASLTVPETDALVVCA